jgi:hypothetical protein
MSRQWSDPRDQKQWRVDAIGIPRRVTFRCIETLEAYSLIAPNGSPLARYPEAELIALLDAARGSPQ